MNDHEFAIYCGFNQVTPGVYERNVRTEKETGDSDAIVLQFAREKTMNGYILSISYGACDPMEFAFESISRILLASSNAVFLKCAIWELLENLEPEQAEIVVDQYMDFPEEVEQAVYDQLDLTTSQLADVILPSFGARRLANIPVIP